MGVNLCHPESTPSVSTDGEGLRCPDFKSSCLGNPRRAAQHQAALPFLSASMCSFPLHPSIPTFHTGWKQQRLAHRCIPCSNKWGLSPPGSQEKAASGDRNRGCPQSQREAQAASCRPWQCKGSCLVSSKLALRHPPSSETTLCWGKGKRDNWILKTDTTAASLYLM